MKEWTRYKCEITKFVDTRFLSPPCTVFFIIEFIYAPIPLDGDSATLMAITGFL